MATVLTENSRAPDPTAISAQWGFLTHELAAAGPRLPPPECGDVQDSVKLGVQLVVALLRLGHAEAARRLLMDLLRIGADHGVWQPFIDGGVGVHLMLRETHDRLTTIDGDMGVWIRMIMRRRHALAISTAPPEVTVSTTRGDGEILSMRQQAVLRLIGQGRSNKQIARDLNLAPETVKSYVKHIFVKLGTQTRAQAVACAVKRGLL